MKNANKTNFPATDIWYYFDKNFDEYVVTECVINLIIYHQTMID